MSKSKSNLTGIPERDACMTPGYALEPLLKIVGHSLDDLHFPVFNRVWEPAAGSGLLANALREHSFAITESDIAREPSEDFFSFTYAKRNCDTIVTNPPFSIKDRFTAHALSLCPKVALLMQSDAVSTEWFYNLCEHYGEPGIIWFSPRINFRMPYLGWEGAGSHFPTAWFTWGWFRGQRFLNMDHWTAAYRKQFEVESDTLLNFRDTSQLSLFSA